MTRLQSCGFEWAITPAASTDIEVPSLLYRSAALSAVESTTVHGGSKSLKCIGNSFGDSGVTGSFTGVNDRSYYLRAWVYVPSTNGGPSITQAMALINGASGTGYSVQLNPIDSTTADLRLYRLTPSTVQVGAAVVPITFDAWHCIELRVKASSTASSDEGELRCDGAIIIADLAQNHITSTLDTYRVGLVTDTSGDFVFIDDLALNDDQGSFQNSWPGLGFQVLLKPTSDSQRGSWTGGAAGTTNLWQALDNVPPVGTATETDTTQIESADSSGNNATDEYRGGFGAYSTLISATNRLQLAWTSICHGEDVATQTKTGSVLLQANPTQSAAEAFTFGNDVGALGTFPTNWRWLQGIAQDASAVALSAVPRLDLRKTDATTRVGSVCAAGIYAEYTAIPTSLPIGRRHRNYIVR